MTLTIGDPVTDKNGDRWQLATLAGRWAGLNYPDGDPRRVPHGDDDRTVITAVPADTLTPTPDLHTATAADE